MLGATTWGATTWIGAERKRAGGKVDLSVTTGTIGFVLLAAIGYAKRKMGLAFEMTACSGRVDSTCGYSAWLSERRR